MSDFNKHARQTVLKLPPHYHDVLTQPSKFGKTAMNPAEANTRLTEFGKSKERTNDASSLPTYPPCSSANLANMDDPIH